MPSKEELLQSIQPGMKLDKAFFLRIYGYEISFPGFRDTAIRALEDAGCSRAKDYYISVVAGYEWDYQQQMKKVAAWMLAQENKKKEGEERRKRIIWSLTRSELTELCRKFLQEGIITEPEQFVMAVKQDH